MNERGAKLVWQNPPARYAQHTVVDHRVHTIGIDPGEREKDQNFGIRFEHVGRRLPGGPAHMLIEREKLLVQPLGTRKPVDRLEPHPACELALCHGLALPFKVWPETGCTGS